MLTFSSSHRSLQNHAHLRLCHLRLKSRYIYLSMLPFLSPFHLISFISTPALCSPPALPLLPHSLPSTRPAAIVQARLFWALALSSEIPKTVPTAGICRLSYLQLLVCALHNLWASVLRSAALPQHGKGAKCHVAL